MVLLCMRVLDDEMCEDEAEDADGVDRRRYGEVAEIAQNPAPGENAVNIVLPRAAGREAVRPIPSI